MLYVIRRRAGNAKALMFECLRPKGQGRISLVVCEVSLQGETNLVQIGNALNLLRSGLGVRNRREQQRRQNSDDGDDDQQFHQRERCISPQIWSAHTEIDSSMAGCSRSIFFGVWRS